MKFSVGDAAEYQTRRHLVRVKVLEVYPGVARTTYFIKAAREDRHWVVYSEQLTPIPALEQLAEVAE